MSLTGEQFTNSYEPQPSAQIEKPKGTLDPIRTADPKADPVIKEEVPVVLDTGYVEELRTGFAQTCNNSEHIIPIFSTAAMVKLDEHDEFALSDYLTFVSSIDLPSYTFNETARKKYCRTLERAINHFEPTVGEGVDFVPGTPFKPAEIVAQMQEFLNALNGAKENAIDSPKKPSLPEIPLGQVDIFMISTARSNLWNQISGWDSPKTFHRFASEVTDSDCELLRSDKDHYRPARMTRDVRDLEVHRKSQLDDFLHFCERTTGSELDETSRLKYIDLLTRVRERANKSADGADIPVFQINSLISQLTGLRT